MIFRRAGKWVIGLTILSIITILVSGCVVKTTPIITKIKTERELVPPLSCCPIECIASDAEGGKLSYNWSASGGSIMGEGAAIIWIAPEELGKYTISVNVTDEWGNWTGWSIAITVRENKPPEIIDLEASEEWVVPSGRCTVECTASDPEGDSLSYEWLASGGNITGEGSIVTWDVPEEIGNYTITVVVTDGVGGVSTTSLSMEVAVNHPPVIESVKTQYPQLKPTHSTTIECVASDPDGDELSYTWSASAGRISAVGCTATWGAPDCYGTYNIAVVVKDGRGGEASQTVQFKVGCG